MIIVPKWISKKLPTDYFFPLPNPLTWLVHQNLLHLSFLQISVFLYHFTPELFSPLILIFFISFFFFSQVKEVTPLLLHLSLQFYFQLLCQSWEGQIVRDERERQGATGHRLSSRRENKKPEFIPAGKWISAEIGRNARKGAKFNPRWNGGYYHSGLHTGTRYSRRNRTKFIILLLTLLCPVQYFMGQPRLWINPTCIW